MRILLLILMSISYVQSASAQEKNVPQSSEQIKLSYAPLVKKVAPSVVNIYTTRIVTERASPFMADPFFEQFFGRGFGFGGDNGLSRQRVSNALGSGVIVDSQKGLVITNAHVIDGADEVTIVLMDGREYEADKVLVDDRSDLAVLDIRADDETFPAVELKPSEALEVGDLVLAIGNPFGVGQTVTSGIVSALARSSLNINDFNFFIQTDAAINPGNSGGPLVAMDGSVIGINTAIYSRTGGSLGIGFAIPSEMVSSVLAAAQNGVESASGIVRPWLGMSGQKVTSDIARSLGMEKPQGVLVSALHKESPAKKAGLKVGDVVLSINGQILRDPPEMKFRMATVLLGEEARFSVLRAGRVIEIGVEAIAPPENPPRDETLLRGRHALAGITVANVNPALVYELGLPLDEDEGVAVLDSGRGVSFFNVFERGDIIVSINNRDIDDIKDLQRAIERLENERSWEIILRRNGRESRILLR